MCTTFYNTFNSGCCFCRWFIWSYSTCSFIKVVCCSLNCFTIFTCCYFFFCSFWNWIITYVTSCKINWCSFYFWFCSDFVNIIFLVDMVSFINMNFIITCQYNWTVIVDNIVFSVRIDSKRFTSNDNSIILINYPITSFIFTISTIFPYSRFIVTTLGIIRKSRINNMRIFRIYFASIWDSFTIMIFTSTTIVYRLWIFVFFVNLTITIFVIQFFKQFWRLIERSIIITWYNKTSSVITWFYKFRCLIVLLIISNIFLTFWNNHFIAIVRITKLVNIRILILCIWIPHWSMSIIRWYSYSNT